MPELTSLSQNSLLAARAFKRIGEAVWVNTYELRYAGATTPSDVYQYLNDVADAIRDAELAIHSNKVTLDRVIISSVEPDSIPYDPETFAVFSYNQTCTGITGVHTLLPLSFCVLVKKIVQFGRNGNILYRGALATTSGQMDSKGFLLGSDTIVRIQGAVGSLINALQQLNTVLALVKLTDSGAVDNVRTVVGASVRPVTTTKKLYNRYFDIGNDTGGGNIA